MNKTSVYVVFILLLLSAIVYFGDAPERILGTSTALKNEVNAVPFAVARNTKTIHYEENGSVGYSFNAKRLEHYRESQNGSETKQTGLFTLIDAPELVIYREDEPWYVQAEKGKVSSEDQNILLWQKVLVKHTSSDGVVTTINTEKLLINPVNRLAKTEEPVRIRSDKIEMSGVGMEADLIQENLKVLSKVQGVYDPT